MAKSKLSSAYKSAASSSSSYKTSLYDIENIGYERKSSAQLAGIKAQDKNRMVGMLSEGIDMAGNVMRRNKRIKEESDAAESLGAKKIDRSLWGKLTGEDQMYEKVGEGGEMGTVSGSDVMAEYKLSQTEKAFGKSDTVDKTTGKTTSTPAPKVAPVIPEVKSEPTLNEEVNGGVSNIYGPPLSKSKQKADPVFNVNLSKEPFGKKKPKKTTYKNLMDFN